MSGVRDQHRRHLLRRMFGAAVAAAHPAKCLPPHFQPVRCAGRLIVVDSGNSGAEGYEVQILGDALDGEAREVAAQQAAMALAAKREGRSVAILSGGS